MEYLEFYNLQQPIVKEEKKAEEEQQWTQSHSQATTDWKRSSNIIALSSLITNRKTKYRIWIALKSIALVQPIVKEEKKAEEEQWTQKPFLGHDGLEEIF